MRSYGKDEKEKAIDLAVRLGPAEESRQCDIPSGTLKRWMHEAGERTSVLPEEIMAEAAARRAKTAFAVEGAKERQNILREEIRETLLLRAKDALDRMVKPYIDFKGNAGTERLYPEAPADAFKAFATAAAILLDKYRLEQGETTAHTSVDISGYVAKAARDAGLDDAEVMAEVNRILAEAEAEKG